MGGRKGNLKRILLLLFTNKSPVGRLTPLQETGGTGKEKREAFTEAKVIRVISRIAISIPEKKNKGNSKGGVGGGSGLSPTDIGTRDKVSEGRKPRGKNE